MKTTSKGPADNKYVHRLSKPQWEVFSSPKRFRITVAGRRFGKTHLAIREMFKAAIRKDEAMVWYIAPTYKMAKQIAWRDLKKAIPTEYVESKNETDLSITLVNGSMICLRGADNPDSLRGPGLDFVVLDEAAFILPEVWKVVVRPMLSDRKGSAIFITTPFGYNWVYDLFVSAPSKSNWERFQFTTIQGGNVTAEEIEEARADMDIRSFRQEYEASFENLFGRVYYAFDRVANMKKVEDISMLPLLVGMDFNVNPMSAVLGVMVGGQIHILDEITIPNGDTEIMSQEITRRYPDRDIVVYPDPTGNARRTNAPAGQTDFTILRRYGFTVLAPKAPYAVVDKINMTNAAFCNAKGTRRVFLKESRCPNLVKGLDGLTYKQGTSIPDKSLGLDHITDALAYMLCWEFPIRAGSTRVAEVAFQ